MPTPIDFTPPEGPFLSFLHWMDRGGQMPLNLVQGRFGAAGRQALDFLGEIPDAFLPGDMIPNATRRGDDTTPSRALGISDDASEWIRGPVDFVGGIAANPLSYVGAAPAKLAGAGLSFLADSAHALAPLQYAKAAKTVSTIGAQAKRTLGYRTLRPEDESFLQDARALRKNAEAAASAQYGKIFDGLNEAHQTALGDAFDNLRWKDGKAVGLLDPSTSAIGPSTIADQAWRIGRRVDALAAGNPALDAAKLKAAVPRMLEMNQRLWSDGVKNHVFKATDDAPYGVGDYLQRHFNFDDMDNALPEEMAAGIPTAMAKRKLGTDQDLLGFLQSPDNALVKYERNAVARSLKRAQNQGRLLERAAVGKRYSGNPDFFLAGKGERDLAVAKIDEMRATDPELGNAVGDVFNGLPPRGPLLGALAKANQYWKPYVVYGIIAPKIGSIVRNVLGGAFQVAATPGAAKDLARFIGPKNLGEVFGGAIDDGIEKVMGTRLGGGSELTKGIQAVESALAEGGGTVDGAMARLQDPTLRAAMQHGVLDGFVTSEEVGKRLMKGPITGKAPEWLKNWATMPGDIFQGAEQRMRLGTFLSLVKEHKYTPEAAAQAVRDAFYDYNVWNKSNRTLRDIIPFAAFQTNAMRQSAKWIARNPAVGVAAAQLFPGNDPDHPVPEWVGQQASVRLGKDNDGNPQYATGFGLPIESLNGIPGMSGHDWERAILSKTAPLPKSAWTMLAGHDPYFGNPWGSYDKTPEILQAAGLPEHSATGRRYHELTDLGLNPLDPLIAQLGKVLDPKKSTSGKAIDLLTGANVVSVDEDNALQQVLQRTLAANPQVRTHASLYAIDADPETADILAEYNRVKAEVRKHRDVAAPKPLPIGVD